MKPHVIAASLLVVALLIVTQCVVIGGMALTSAREHGAATLSFYAGMFTLCMQAYDGSGYPAKEVVEACNKYVGEQRELKAHMRPAEGYTP